MRLDYHRRARGVLCGEQSRDDGIGFGFLSHGHGNAPFFIDGYVAASKEDFADPS